MIEKSSLLGYVGASLNISTKTVSRMTAIVREGGKISSQKKCPSLCACADSCHSSQIGFKWKTGLMHGLNGSVQCRCKTDALSKYDKLRSTQRLHLRQFVYIDQTWLFQNGTTNDILSFVLAQLMVLWKGLS